MSDFRILLPEPNTSASAGLFQKLEKALILCEILQASTSKHFSESEGVSFYNSHLTPISVSGEDFREKVFK